MITLIEARNSQGSLLALPLDDISSGFVLADVEGLDPVKATVVSSSFAQVDGEQYHSSRREARNIKIKLGLEPDYASTSVRALRNILYQFFMPKTEVFLRLHDDEGLVVDISGRVETCDVPLFTAEPEANISVICFNPDLVEPVAVELDGFTTSGADESLIQYTGTVESGFWLILSPDRTISDFTFYHRLPDNTTRSLDFAAELLAGDILTISTNRGNKGVTLTRGGVYSSLLYAVSPQSSWLEFFPGDNNIRIQVDGDPVPYQIVYTTKHGGL